VQVRYLLIYFTCDVSMTSVSRSWLLWAATASARCMVRLGAVTDWWRSWPTCLCACVHANGGHFEHTLWLSICFLCTWWTLRFTSRFMQWV